MIKQCLWFLNKSWQQLLHKLDSVIADARHTCDVVELDSFRRGKR